MPDRLPYDSQLSLAAAAFVVSLSRRQQRLRLDLADQISKSPSQGGDYRTADATGRAIENLLLEGHLFSYWVDDSAREVRITVIYGFRSRSWNGTSRSK
jgi:hypothetical protein